MILFLEDWAKYPTARPHLETKNRSWVRLAQVYKRMGVKNHAFHLALVNQSLRDVDPHDPNLTQEEILAIGYEIRINPWYFFREVAQVPSLAGNTRIRLQGNRGNVALFWCFFNHIFTFLIQIRQTGKSLNVDMLVVYLLCVLCTNTKINLLTKDDKLRRENVGRIKDIMEALPYYLKMQTRKDADNGEEVTVKALNNFFKTHLPQMNKQRALNSARGMSTAVMLIDESPFQPNIKISLPAALAAMTAAREQAKAMGEPYGVIMTTTAGKLNEESGAYVYEELSSAMPWTEALFDAANEEDLYEIIKANTRGSEDAEGQVAVNITLNHRQLGKDDEWLRQRIRDSRAKGEDAARDFLNRWTSGTSHSPFTADVADRISKSAKDVLYFDIHPRFKFAINWYITRDELENIRLTRDILMGLDSSEGNGGDYVGLIFTDSKTGATIGRSSMNSLSIHRFTEFIAELLERFPRSLFIPEYKNTGVSIVDGLLQILPSKGIDPFRRVFNWIVQDPITHKDKYDYIRSHDLGTRDPEIYHLWKRFFGFTTSGSGAQSRDTLFGNPLVVGTGRFAERIFDQVLIDQLLALEKRNGRIGHVSGKHDDLVVAWLLNFWFMLNGLNMDFYGIDPMMVMYDTPEQVKESPEQYERKRQQQAIKRQIDETLELLRRESDIFIIERYEHKLRMLDRQLVHEEGEVYSMDELIRKAKNIKKQRFQAAGGQSARHDYLAHLIGAISR